MLTILFTLATILMITIPPLLAALLRRRVNAAWIWFCVGMATFTISQVVHIPLNAWLEDLGILGQINGNENSQPLWQTALILGLTAGLCEELARTAGYALFKKSRNIASGLMLGLGHGGIESIAFGGIQLAAGISSLLPFIIGRGVTAEQYGITAEQLAAIQTQIQTLQAEPWLGFLPAVERVFAIGIHITLSIMVLRAFQRRNPIWVFLAIAYHLLIDAAAVLTAGSIDNALVLEGLFFLVALPGYIWLFKVVQKELPKVGHVANPIRREWAMFATALRKELLQLWRTRRVLIIGVVFGFFGLSSPLLAYFMPELMKAIPGAEAFASLVPVATTGDAMVQYHKNLTQFAFLLAVVLGMGSVAGEKEHGSATLVLSKPLPRWAFLSSKLAAQALLFVFGFSLAALGGYLYSVILFGRLEPGPFILMNLVLMVWIIPFISLTLVGSVLAPTTTAAGGIALALVILLTLVSGIPLISSLSPGALSAWAGQLGLLAGGVAPSTPGSMPMPVGMVYPNLGALATALGLMIVCLVVAFGFFEQQEL